MNRKVVTAVVIAFSFVISIVYVGIIRARAGIGIPNNKDSQAIQEVILHSYTVFRGALRNGGDVSEFANVFTNTRDYTYENDDVRAFVGTVLGTEKADEGGYLTAMQAKYIAYGCAIRFLSDIEVLAKMENREVTSSEIKTIQGKCYGVLPPGLSEEAMPKFDFVSIEIDNDRAIVRYDDGAALLEAIVVRKDNQWLIANIKPIEIHF